MEMSTTISIHDLLSTEKEAKVQYLEIQDNGPHQSKNNEGRPSAISVELMLTNLICLQKENCTSNVLEDYRPFSLCNSSLLDIITSGHACAVVHKSK